MSDQEEPIRSEGRPDTSQDERREDGLAVFKQMENEAPQPAAVLAFERMEAERQSQAQTLLDQAELSGRRASPHNLRLVPRNNR